MYARPKPDDSEEDLLKQQEEFLKLKTENKITPAANFSSSAKKPENEASNSSSQEEMEINLQEKIANTFEAIPEFSSIGSVIENVAPRNAITTINFPTKRGFPEVKKREGTQVSSKNNSIFAQQMKKVRKELASEVKDMDVDEPSTSQQKDKVIFPIKSVIVTGNDRDDIHKKNVSILQEMSEKEILEEREKLIATMDPAIVAFLRSKRSKLDAVESSTLSISQQNQAAEDVNIDELEASKEVLNLPKAEKWLNFDSIEANKLAWMKDVNIPKIKKNEAYEARFDFSGSLLPFSEPEMTEKSRVLYHHGDEPGRPGYTLQELFQLARSSVIQQKVIALNSIANILSLKSTGVYENVIEIPIEQIFFVVRFCLDDNTPSVLNAAVKAMRNLFYNEIDEACLDRLVGYGLGTIQPLLSVSDEAGDDKTINDQQLAEADLVKCLVRTDILIRIRYIINTVKPSTETMAYCLDILCCLARNSDSTVEKMFNCEGLIKIIVETFVPKILSSSNKPLQQAMKLLRLIAVRSKGICEEFVNKYKIMDSLTMYLSNEVFSQNAIGLKLQIETLRLWAVFIHYKVALEQFRVLQPVMFQLLNYHVRNTDVNVGLTYVRQGHVGALLNLFYEVLENNYDAAVSYLHVIKEVLILKWSEQFQMVTDIKQGLHQIIASVLPFSIWLKSHNNDCRQMENSFLRLVHSHAFDQVTENMRETSNLLNNIETTKSSPNLLTVEASAWESKEHVLPILRSNCPFKFVGVLLQYICISDNRELKLAFLNHRNIVNYLSHLQKAEKYFLVSNWFTQTESSFVMDILKLAVSMKNDVDTAFFYKLAVKCLNIFNEQQGGDIEFVFRNVIFSTQFYPSEILMQSMQITENKDTLERSLANLGEILDVYLDVFNLRKKNADSLVLNVKLGGCIPVDWIYLPILILYSNQQDKKIVINDEIRQIHTVKNCLRWIYIYELYFPELADFVHVTDRFCRLACLFLGSDDLFLDPEIQKLLELCLKLMISRKGHELDFNREIQGLNNFQDLYTQLLEQYQGVSYGNVLFGNFVLIPLARKQNVKWKKILWSEYLAVVQILNVTAEQLIYPLEEFLTPEETDISLLKCYRLAMNRNIIKKQSVLHFIANHHVEKFVERRKLEKQMEVDSKT